MTIDVEKTNDLNFGYVAVNHVFEVVIKKLLLGRVESETWQLNLFWHDLSLSLKNTYQV